MERRRSERRRQFQSSVRVRLGKAAAQARVGQVFSVTVIGFFFTVYLNRAAEF